MAENNTMRSIFIATCTLCLFSMAQAAGPEDRQTDYPAVAAAIDRTLHAWLYDPAELDRPPYRRVEADGQLKGAGHAGQCRRAGGSVRIRLAR